MVHGMGFGCAELGSRGVWLQKRIEKNKYLQFVPKDT